MANFKRMSQSLIELPVSPTQAPAADSEEWIAKWKGVYARDVIDSRIVSVEAEKDVEDACEVLLSEDILCLAVKSQETDSSKPPFVGLFDFSDVNAFLTLAATRHTLLPEDLLENHRVNQIVAAALEGRVPIKLVSNLSEKNPLETLPYDANIISLLEVFSRGTHRVLIQSPPPSTGFVGMVSDRGLLSWLSSYALESPSLQKYLSNSLHYLALPSINIYDAIIATTSSSSVLDAMKLMSEQGVSSVAILDDIGNLLSAVSVTDIGKIVVPSQSNQILSSPLGQFISQIKAIDGSTDGAEKHPVYSVLASSSLSYTMQKLLATNAHRVFVTTEPSGSASPVMSSNFSGNLSGLVSIVDILAVFARLANIPNIDPTRMQRHRRASSTSSQSSKSEREFTRSRSNSRTSTRLSPSLITDPGSKSARNSISGLDSFQWAERVALERKLDLSNV